MKKICVLLCCLFTYTLVMAQVEISIDANSENKPISPYLYGLNGYGKSVKYNSEEFASRVFEAGVHMTRQNSGNNATKYNWRKKLTSHPNWYNNVHDEDWDLIAQTMQIDFPDVQGMFAFQLLGRVASTKDYNFPDWEYNKAQRWEGCEKNYAGNGSKPGDYKFTEGDVTLYTQEWPADSTAAIITHWEEDLGYGQRSRNLGRHTRRCYQGNERRRV